MEMLWGDDEFDYSKMMNPPKQMITDEGDAWLLRDDIGGYWCAESELYAIFKDRLQKNLKTKLSHEKIAKQYMRLIDHHRLGIVWFGPNHTFRSILQAWEHPWWSESTWLGRKKIVYARPGYKMTNLRSYIKSKLGFLLQHIQIFKQKYYMRKYFNDN
jgi:hypothetical protein